MPFEPLKHPYFDVTQVALWNGQEAENELKVSCDPLKHRFLDFNRVAFSFYQEEENEFPMPGYHLKHRFLDLTKVEFWGFQEAKKLLLCAIRPLDSSLYRLEKSHFLLVN